MASSGGSGIRDEGWQEGQDRAGAEPWPPGRVRRTTPRWVFVLEPGQPQIASRPQAIWSRRAYCSPAMVRRIVRVPDGTAALCVQSVL